MTTTVYDARGLVARTIDAKAQTATFSYNARSEQTAVVYINNQRISTEYNALGQATAYQDPTGITTQVFDERGMLLSVEAPSHPSGAALTYGFDALGQRTQMALLAIAELGGWQRYRRAPPPEVKSLWVGWITLRGMVAGYQLARAEM